MSIIDLTGQTLESDTKRSHDPQRVMAIRQQLSNLLGKLKQEWMQDNGGDPNGATVPNEPAIDQEYIRRWVDQCTTIMNSSDPVVVDPEAMGTWITEQRKARKLKEELATPLHQMASLEPYGFTYVACRDIRALWVSSECAVLLESGGTMRLYLREQHRSPEQFYTSVPAQLVMDRVFLAAVDYTLGELTNLLSALRRERPTPPSPARVQALCEILDRAPIPENA